MWAARTLKACVKAELISRRESTRIEECMSVDRGLAAKQIAYATTPVPKPLQPLASVAIHVWLILVVYNTSIRSAKSYAAFDSGDSYEIVSHIVPPMLNPLDLSSLQLCAKSD